MDNKKHLHVIFIFDNRVAPTTPFGGENSINPLHLKAYIKY